MSELAEYNPRLDPEALLTQKEAAALLGLTYKKLEKDRRLGVGIPYIRLSSNRVRYRRRDVLAYVESLRTQTRAA